jgi:hypothetical protein
MIFKPAVRSMETVHLSCVNINTMSKRTETSILLETCHLGIPLGVSKMIYESMVCSVQTMHLSCIKISTISKLTELSFHLSLVSKEYHQVRPEWFLSLWYVWPKLCTYLASPLTLSPNRPKRDSTWPTPPRRSIQCIQTMHLSCIKISTISKWTKSSFHLSLVT